MKINIINVCFYGNITHIFRKTKHRISSGKRRAFRFEFYRLSIQSSVTAAAISIFLTEAAKNNLHDGR